MLISSQYRPIPSFPSMSYTDNHSTRSHQTNTSSSFVPTTVLPKHFNVPFAVQNGYFRCVRYLLELNYDPNERDNQLRTPLILCSYVENDRWSLSLAQNLLEKGAKIALEDHARRNAMHHACALQRIHLVQLYLSCLDFNLESKDCEGNTCLHYVAITGNCEIAELLIKAAEKMGVRLDQFVNREGCSAAVLALKYGHIECANQITHRDWDEFFVVPRPLSIYETPPATDIHHQSSITPVTTITKKKRISNPITKTDIRPSALSFGLLKIIFNESDSSYSTRLAGLCHEKKQTHHRRRVRHKKIQKPDSTDYSSTEALINELKTPTNDDQEKKLILDENENIRTSPRIQLLKQHLLKENNTKSNHLSSNSTINYLEPTVSILYDSPRTNTKLQRPKTAVVTRNQTSVNAVGAPSRLSSPPTQRTPTDKKRQKKSRTITNRPHSASVLPKPNSNLTSESTTYSQTLYNGRPLSAVLQNQHRYPPAQRTIDSSCTIREAKGAASRYNKPEELFGLKPEELFGSNEHQPKIINPSKTPDSGRSKRTNQPKQEYIWQQDMNKLVDWYNIQHTSNYRQPAVPPAPSVLQAMQTSDFLQLGKPRTAIGSKAALSNFTARSSANSKLSTITALSMTRRNSITRHPAIKVTNA